MKDTRNEESSEPRYHMNIGTIQDLVRTVVNYVSRLAS